MNQYNFFKNNLLTFTHFIILFPNFGILKNCTNKNLFKFGINSICTLKNGLPIDCFNNSYDITKAYIKCDDGYYNNENKIVQTLNCNQNNGKWIEQQIECLPDCLKLSETNIRNLELIEEADGKIFPEWYSEIIRKDFIPGKFNRIPGIILSETQILTLRQYVEVFYDPVEHPITSIIFAEKFFTRIYRNETNFGDYQITSIACSATPPNFGEFCIIYIDHKEYIKYNKDVKPICIKTLDDIKLIKFSKRYSILKNRYSALNQCFVPRVINPEIEMACYKKHPDPKQIYHVTNECRKETYALKKMCQRNFNYITPNDIDYMKACSVKYWYNRDNDCNLVCGQIDQNIDNSIKIIPKIYNGIEQDITVIPWHVGIYFKRSKYFQQICGGTIIHSKIVISAAHCFYDVVEDKISEVSKFRIGAGKILRDYEIKEENSLYTGIDEIHVPESFHPIENLYDIAILVLDQHLKFSAYIKPVCIDFTKLNDYSIKSGVKGQIPGWGATSEIDNFSDVLLTTHLKTLTNEECKNRINENYRSEIVGDRFCALNENGGTACIGDSGGGFFIKRKIGFIERYYLIGVISNSIDPFKYCTDDSITLFTNIKFYQKFINEIIAENINKENLKNMGNIL